MSRHFFEKFSEDPICQEVNGHGHNQALNSRELLWIGVRYWNYKIIWTVFLSISVLPPQSFNIKNLIWKIASFKSPELKKLSFFQY